MARVSYDVDPDPVEPHEVKPIPPQEITFPEAPKSVLEGGTVGSPSAAFPPAYNPFNDPVPPGTVYGPGADDYGRKKGVDLSGIQLPPGEGPQPPETDGVGFGAILHEPWVASTEPGLIHGKWAVDGSPYDVRVPEQLVDVVVRLQNLLSRKYNAVREIEAKLARAKRELAALFGG